MTLLHSSTNLDHNSKDQVHFFGELKLDSNASIAMPPLVWHLLTLVC